MKLQVTVSDEMVKRIDEYAKKMGVSRSALCSVFIGQGIMNYDKASELVTNLGERLRDEIEEILKEREKK